MKFVPGRRYRTHRGHCVLVLSTTEEAPFPVRGEVTYTSGPRSGSTAVRRWTKQGVHNPKSTSRSSPLDLVGPWSEPKVEAAPALADQGVRAYVAIAAEEDGTFAIRAQHSCRNTLIDYCRRWGVRHDMIVEMAPVAVEGAA